MRLRFVEDASGPRQALGPADGWSLTVIDASAEPDPPRVVEAWIAATVRRPFVLDRWPLFTQALFKATPDRYFWCYVVHHVVFDGFS